MTVFLVLPETLRCLPFTTNSQHESSHHNMVDLNHGSSYNFLLPSRYLIRPRSCLLFSQAIRLVSVLLEDSLG